MLFFVRIQGLGLDGHCGHDLRTEVGKMANAGYKCGQLICDCSNVISVLQILLLV